MEQLIIDQWVKKRIYELLEEAMTKGPADAATLTPLIQMYSALQLKEASSDLAEQLEKINHHLSRLLTLSDPHGKKAGINVIVRQ